jgi:hypothetical protein
MDSLDGKIGIVATGFYEMGGTTEFRTEIVNLEREFGKIQLEQVSLIVGKNCSGSSRKKVDINREFEIKELNI